MQLHVPMGGGGFRVGMVGSTWLVYSNGRASYRICFVGREELM